MDRGHTVLFVRDERLDVVPEIILLRHDFEVLHVKGDGSPQESVNQLAIELMIMQVVVVILSSLCQDRGADTLDSSF